VANSPVLVVLKDTNPVYFWSKTGNPASPPQYMNKHMKHLKDGVRTLLRKNPVHMGCHSSANVEETALALDFLRGKVAEITALPSSRPDVKPEGGFKNLQDVCKWTNEYGGGGQSQGPFGGCIKVARTGMPNSVDLFTNDYFTFKTLVGAVATDKLNMRENGEKGSVACTIEGGVGGVEVRSLDDNYVDGNWTADALATADRVSGVMTELHAGMLSLYILLTYHDGVVGTAEGEYIRTALKDKIVYVTKQDGGSVRVKLGLSATEMGGREAKVMLLNFMAFNGYELESVADGYEKTAKALKKPSRWWKELKGGEVVGEALQGGELLGALSTVAAGIVKPGGSGGDQGSGGSRAVVATPPPSPVAASPVVPSGPPLAPPSGPPFASLSDLFLAANQSPSLKYVLCKNVKYTTASGLVVATRDYTQLLDPSNLGNINDVDILVNSIEDFTKATGAVKRQVTPSGYHHSVDVGGVPVVFDLHFAGDNFVDGKWESDIVDRGIVEEGTGIKVPSVDDELYLTLYHMLIRKSKPLQSEYLPRVKELIAAGGAGVEDLESEEKMLALLNRFMDSHAYEYTKPLDKNIGFNPP